jgi:predicted small secreted protein
MKTSTGLIVALLVCAMMGAGALGCNTFRGMGKDIQRGGEAVENAADDTQNEMERPNMITAAAETGGSISPSGSINMPYRSSRTFTIKANRGYHVADVLVDGKSVGARTRYTFDNVTANHTISAMFTGNSSR